MPADLIRVEDADLDAANVEPGLLAAYRAYLPTAVDDRRGLLILAAPSEGGHHLLMLLARRIGAALRDENIRLRDSGGDVRAGKLRLCYLPGSALTAARRDRAAATALVTEAACFLYDVERCDPEALRELLDERLPAGLPTFLQAAPGSLPSTIEADARARLPVLAATAPRDASGRAQSPTSGGVEDERADLGTTL
jgi:hypothetical protein